MGAKTSAHSKPEPQSYQETSWSKKEVEPGSGIDISGLGLGEASGIGMGIGIGTKQPLKVKPTLAIMPAKSSLIFLFVCTSVPFRK